MLFLDKEQAQADRYMQLLTGIAHKVKSYINVVVFNVDASVIQGKQDTNASVKVTNEALKTEIGSKKLPVFKYYRNVG